MLSLAKRSQAVHLELSSGWVLPAVSSQTKLVSVPHQSPPPQPKTDLPGRQALVSMTQVFIDTIVICSITGITIVMGGLYTGDTTVADLTSATFGKFLGQTGSVIVAVGLLFFASSTIIGWSYYGEKCFSYLFSKSVVFYYRMAFVVAVFIGAISQLEVVWGVADVMNGLMAFPNLIRYARLVWRGRG